MRQKASAFPIGLYGMLLLALCWLTVPRLFAPLERLLLGAVSLPARVVAEWSGTPALAASRDVLRERQAQADRLNERLHHFDAIGGRELMPADRVPQFCFVRSVDRRVAGGGVAGELRLDHTYRELAGCDELVTKGGALVGRLARLGVGPATDDGPDDFARVVLLNHAGAPPVYGGLSLADGEHLRFLVGPSAKVDPAPLRVDLWDNAYRAAKLDRGGQDVFTIEFSGGGVRQPAGLWLGQTRVWGYEALRTGEVLSIGVFLMPPYEPAALSHVVLWRDRAADGGDPPGAVAPQRHAPASYPATLWELPVAAGGRHLLACRQGVVDGAAVVSDGLFVGSARGIAFGLGLVTSFANSRNRWTLILLPADPAERPRELEGEVVATEGNLAWLRWRGETATTEDRPMPVGLLFTGCNGPHCPPGLLIGGAVPHAWQRDLLQVTTSAEVGTRACSVLVGEERS